MKDHWQVVDGTPFYRVPASGRLMRGRWSECLECGVISPSSLSNSGRTCSSRCSGRMARRLAGARAKARPDLFSILDHDEAWLLGWIWADGCLHEDSRSGHAAHIIGSSVDDYIAEEAARIAGVAVRHYESKRENERTSHSVRIGGRIVVDRARALGLAPRKSLTCLFPQGLPHEVVPTFIRGYFDGDGTVGRYGHPNLSAGMQALKSGFIGSRPFLDSLQNILDVSADICPKTVSRHGAVARVQYNAADSRRLAAYMYSCPGPALERKRAIFVGEGL